MPVLALIQRILRQLKHDRRTLALLFIAPLFLLTLVSFILNHGTDGTITLAAVNCPQPYIERLEDAGAQVLRMEEAQAADALYCGEIIASLEYTDYILRVKLDGSNSSRSAQTLAMLQTAWTPNIRSAANLQVDYLYGYDGLSMFDNFGSVLIGFFIFFFVFLIAGISFLQERTSGTLEKLLSMPIERWQIVIGYALGFGILATLQSFLIALFCIYGLKIMMVGNFFLVLLIVIMAAISALTLGILLSTVANNEFQMIQFIPIVIIPQIFFSGLFELPTVLEPIKYLMPLYYTADALTAVMIKGKGFVYIWRDLLFLAGCSLLFMLVNIRVLKKYRNI